MTNREISEILEEIGTILEIRGENPFKCRAFHNAARTLGTLTLDLRAAVAGGTLTDIPGIGKGLAPIISDLATTGASEEYDTIRASVPAGLLVLVKIQGLGPKKIRVLHEKLAIDSPARLREAAEAGRLAALEGFGPKSQDNILRGLAMLERSIGKRLFPDAEAIAAAVLERLLALPGVVSCSVAGSLRRKKEIIGDIDLLAGAPAKNVSAILSAFLDFPGVSSKLASGQTKASVLLSSGIQCDLRVVSEAEYPFALQYFTGSREHNVELRALAGTLGLSLNEYGFSAAKKPAAKNTRSGNQVKIPACREETDIYRALGLRFIPPELREATGEIGAAADGTIPTLVSLDDLLGTFHCHTTYSDGRNSLKEMVEAAKTLKWKYIGIADHSKAAAYAGGLKEKDVERQLEEIASINGVLKGFRVFSGTEVDILADGTLDWNDRILERFDYVVASIHSKFAMSEAEATRRVVRALKNPHVTMLGHPTGRLLLEREGYPINLRDVIDAASDYGKMIEINSNPHRLDLDWTFCRYAKEKGVLLVINPDAHWTGGLADVQYGINVARRGWLGPADILNTRNTGDVVTAFGRG